MSQLYDESVLSRLLQQVSVEVYDLIKNKPFDSIVFIGIVTNGVFFATRVQEKLKSLGCNIECPVMSLDISLYRDDLAKSKEYLSIGKSSNTINLDGKHVVFFDDVISTGRTARASLNAIFDYGRPEFVSYVVLFDRKFRQVPIQPNIRGKELDIPEDTRVNVVFMEVMGEDAVMLGPMNK